LNPAAVVAMRKASKGTSRLTNVQMEKVCAAPVTVKELLSIIDEIQLPFGIEIGGTNGRIVIADEAKEIESFTIYLDEAKAKLEKALERQKRVAVSAREKRVNISPRAMITVVEHRLSCVKLSPALPRLVARSTLADYAKTELKTHVSANEIRDIIGLLQGTNVIEATFPPRTSTLSKSKNLRFKIIGLHNNVDWITATSTMHGVEREDWQFFTDEEVKARYFDVLNEEIDRLRALYQSL
jgi:hypothetical protein